MANQISSINPTCPRGFPVTKESAEQVYCGLGKNWWKQLYDGKYHTFGVEVFDKGLHGHGAESGFYNSALKAFEFGKRHLNEKLSVEFYRDLHKEACAHFQGKKNTTEMKARDAGRFRSIEQRGVRCTFYLDAMLKFFDGHNQPERIVTDYCILRNTFGDQIVEICAYGSILKDKNWAREFTIITANAQELENLIQKKFDALKEALNEWDKDPFVKNAIPGIALRGDKLRIDYKEPRWHDFSFDVVIPHLFGDFNRTLSEINEELTNTSPTEREKIDSLVERKLVLIKNLYQNLEWLHPYPDGQGRTDLLLLAKLLSENGFTPAILEEPYMSSFSSREDWLVYLKEGMQKWEEEREKGI